MNENEEMNLNQRQNHEVPKKQKGSITSYLSIIAIAVSAVAIISCVIIFFTLSKSNQELRQLFQNQNSSFTKDIESLKKENPQIEIVKIDLAATNFSMFVSEGVVTDKFIIQKANFYVIDGLLRGSIDLRGQPSYIQYFEGKGNFSLSDRKLRADLLELVNQLEDSLKGDLLGDVYSVKLGDISITQNNYAVADYKDGKIVLSGN